MAKKYIVNDFGALFFMTESKYRKYLARGIDDAFPDAEDYGTRIGCVAFHATDAEPRDFEYALQILDDRRQPSGPRGRGARP